MTKFKKAFVIILILELLFCYLLAIRRTDNLILPFQELSFYLCLGIILVPSFFIAFIVIALFYKDGFEHKILFYCHLLIFSSFLMLNAYWFIEKKYVGDKVTEVDFAEEQKKAWIALKIDRGNSDNIHLKSLWMEEESEQNPLTFYITYFFENEFQNEHYSRIIKFDDNYIVAESGIAKESSKIDSLKNLIPEEVRSWLEE